jgi:RES domain-containing protein
MTPLPPTLGGGELDAWRIDDGRYAADWNTGTGAELWGGRWNLKGTAAVYASLDPATALVEVAVHKGFAGLDTVGHTLTRIRIVKPEAVHVVGPDAVPDADWLAPGLISVRQMAYGDQLLATHGAILIPSAVSRDSWNLVARPGALRQIAVLIGQSRLVVDPRLHRTGQDPS